MLGYQPVDPNAAPRNPLTPSKICPQSYNLGALHRMNQMPNNFFQQARTKGTDNFVFEEPLTDFQKRIMVRLKQARDRFKNKLRIKSKNVFFLKIFKKRQVTFLTGYRFFTTTFYNSRFAKSPNRPKSRSLFPLLSPIQARFHIPKNH